MHRNPLTCGGAVGLEAVPVVPRQASAITDTTTLAELQKLPLADVLPLLVGRATRSYAREYGPKGNLFFRAMLFADAGSKVDGHAHHYDHVTYLRKGALTVLAWPVDPKTGEAIGPRVERHYAAPCAILIKKEMAHELTALEAGTEADCIFALRDAATGDVVDEWDGSLHPYV